jgi:hypothetical protein
MTTLECHVLWIRQADGTYLEVLQKERLGGRSFNRICRRLLAGLKLPTCSSETFLPTSVDREVVVGACEAAALSRSRTLFGGGRILEGLAFCVCFLRG